MDPVPFQRSHGQSEIPDYGMHGLPHSGSPPGRRQPLPDDAGSQTGYQRFAGCHHDECGTEKETLTSRGNATEGKKRTKPSGCKEPEKHQKRRERSFV